METEDQYIYTTTWFKANAKNFKTWFNEDTYDWSRASYLILFCGEFIDIWWQPNRMDIHRLNYRSNLIKHCLESLDVWYDSYQWDLTKEQLICKELYT